MKTITVDWETYQEELKAKYETGYTQGLWHAAKYLMQEETWPLTEVYWFEKRLLEQARAKITTEVGKSLGH